jgi:hypothetical protein
MDNKYYQYILYILVLSILMGYLTYFMIKLLMKFRKNNAKWKQIFTGMYVGDTCINNKECASNNCQLNICMV